MGRAMLYAAAAAACAAILTSRPAAGDGMMVPSEQEWNRRRERSFINEPEQKAVVYYHARTEDLIISPSYAGPSDRFAWLVPVPARPRVEIVKGALFHELARLVMPRPRYRGLEGPAAVAGSVAAKVTVLKRKAVGAYDVSVLAATDGGALMKWLRANRYRLPDAAAEPVRAYVRQRWTFVACRVRVPRAAAGLHSGTLAPLRLTFRTERPVYPMRLSSANPEPFTVLVYVLLPPASDERGPSRIRAVAGPGVRGPTGAVAYRAARVPGGSDAWPTVARLAPGGADVFMVRRHRLDPADCTEDFAWDVARPASIR